MCVKCHFKRAFERSQKRDDAKICGRKQKGLRLDYADLR